MRSRIGSAQSGFSLIELMVAMVVTMIVSGAIYGLLAGGKSAFRREPELTDRQQNIRAAMDMIMRDIANAGAGMPSFVQVFTRNLNACTGCPNGGAPMGPDGQVTDELEILTNPGFIENEPVCHTPGDEGSSAVVRLVRGVSSLPPQTPVIVVMEDGTWTVRNIVSTGTNKTSAATCDSVDHVQLNFNSGAGDASGLNPAAGICQPSENGLGNAGTVTGAPCALSPPAPGCTCVVTHVTFGEVVRYRIRNDAGGVPVLQRFTTGDAASGFQAVANGVEELQVQYLQQNGSLSPGAAPADPNGAPAVLSNQHATLITEVRVTLSARSELYNLQGATGATSARDALRGRLASAGSPRTALISLTKAQPAPLWK